MPATATITTYNDFEARQRARASEVDQNFLNHRGHVIPINTDTASASNNTHDLGATDHQWRSAYLQNAPYVGGTQLNKIPIGAVYDGSVPPSPVDDIGSLGRVGFQTDVDTDVVFDFSVPPQYRVGQRMSLNIRGYPETTGSCVFYSTTHLHRVDSTNITGSSTPAAVLTGTATLANSVAGLFVEDTSLKLTDASGLINGTTVTVGDILSVRLQRKATATGDTNTGKWFLTNMFVDLNL